MLGLSTFRAPAARVDQQGAVECDEVGGKLATASVAPWSRGLRPARPSDAVHTVHTPWRYEHGSKVSFEAYVQIAEFCPCSRLKPVAERGHLTPPRPPILRQPAWPAGICSDAEPRARTASDPASPEADRQPPPFPEVQQSKPFFALSQHVRAVPSTAFDHPAATFGMPPPRCQFENGPVERRPSPTQRANSKAGFFSATAALTTLTLAAPLSTTADQAPPLHDGVPPVECTHAAPSTVPVNASPICSATGVPPLSPGLHPVARRTCSSSGAQPPSLPGHFGAPGTTDECGSWPKPSQRSRWQHQLM